MSVIIAQRRIDLRKAPRKPLHYPVWIDLGDGTCLRDGMVYDVSETGARLTLADDEQVPDSLVLLLSRNGSARRHCQIVWRSGINVGIKFVPENDAIKLDC